MWKIHKGFEADDIFRVYTITGGTDSCDLVEFLLLQEDIGASLKQLFFRSFNTQSRIEMLVNAQPSFGVWTNGARTAVRFNHRTFHFFPIRVSDEFCARDRINPNRQFNPKWLFGGLGVFPE